MRAKFVGEYNDILKTYLEFGLKGMNPSEISFLKTNGEQGMNVRNGMRPDIRERFEKILSYLLKNKIEFEFKDSWAPSFGWFNFLELPWNKRLFDIFTNILPSSEDDIVPYVRKFENYIHVYQVDNEWYKDIIKFDK